MSGDLGLQSFPKQRNNLGYESPVAILQRRNTNFPHGVKSDFRSVVVYVPSVIIQAVFVEVDDTPAKTIACPLQFALPGLKSGFASANVYLRAEYFPQGTV